MPILIAIPMLMWDRSAAAAHRSSARSPTYRTSPMAWPPETARPELRYSICTGLLLRLVPGQRLPVPGLPAGVPDGHRPDDEQEGQRQPEPEPGSPHLQVRQDPGQCHDGHRSDNQDDHRAPAVDAVPTSFAVTSWAFAGCQPTPGRQPGIRLFRWLTFFRFFLISRAHRRAVLGPSPGLWPVALWR